MHIAIPARGADAPYVPTPWNVVEAMLKLGGVGAGDFLIDLGSGDGRIVITAAKQLGARGMGVDLDDNLVRTARREAAREGVGDRVSFVKEDLFFVDLAKASVLTLYMSESVNLRLRPALFKLKPGTRVLSHDFDMAQWMPDDKVTVPVPNKPYGAPKSEIFLWVIPADASGRWHWQLPQGAANREYDAAFDQAFQMLSGTVQAGGRGAKVHNARVRGDSVRFSAVIEREGSAQRHEFSGRIAGDVIEGHVAIDGVQTPWRATRVARGKLDIDATLSMRIAQRGY
jgi:SAM-dependent methyltransferase